MASAVDRTIGASMGDLSRRIKRIIKAVTTELREEMQELEIQKRMAETGREYHMKESHMRKLENIKMKAKLDKCERIKRQLDMAKALAKNAMNDKKKLQAQIDALQEQLRVAREALDRVNQTKLRF
jgi:chromosome segregation ATPase